MYLSWVMDTLVWPRWSAPMRPAVPVSTNRVERGLGSFEPRADDNSDYNGDDSCCLDYVTDTTIPDVSPLFTASAWSWQCGGQGFESS